MARRSKKYPEKHKNIMKIIKEAVESGNYSNITDHAKDKKNEKMIDIAEYEYVLKNGRHEARKDEYSELYKSWKYAIRGTTSGERDIRIIVAIEKGLVIITLIAIGEENGKTY